MAGVTKGFVHSTDGDASAVLEPVHGDLEVPEAPAETLVTLSHVDRTERGVIEGELPELVLRAEYVVSSIVARKVDVCYGTYYSISARVQVAPSSSETSTRWMRRPPPAYA